MTSIGITSSVETQAVVEALQGHRRAVYQKLKPHVFRVVSEYNGTVIGRATGFRPYRDHEIIISAGHINNAINPNDPASPRPSNFFAEYPTGEKVDLVLVKASIAPDLSILKPVAGMALLDIQANLVGGSCSIGDDVYILGCKGLSPSACLSFTHGIVSGSSYVGAEVSLTAHSDNGISGGIVASCRGEILGVLVGGEGTTILQSRMVLGWYMEHFIRNHFNPCNQLVLPSLSPEPMEDI